MKEICAGPTTIRRIVYNRSLSKFNFFNFKADGDLETLAESLPEGGQFREDHELMLEPCVQGLLINVKTPEGITGPTLLPWPVIEVMKIIGGYRSMSYLYESLYNEFIKDR